MKARVVLGGRARGAVLRVDEPLSFWGGVDATTGCLCDPRSPLCGTPLAGRVLMMAEPVGSSSSSAIMLELMARGLQPAAIVMGRVDAIVGLGVIVAGEMGYGTIPVLELDPAAQAAFAQGAPVEIGLEGDINVVAD